MTDKPTEPLSAEDFVHQNWPYEINQQFIDLIKQYGQQQFELGRGAALEEATRVAFDSVFAHAGDCAAKIRALKATVKDTP